MNFHFLMMTKNTTKMKKNEALSTENENKLNNKIFIGEIVGYELYADCFVD